MIRKDKCENAVEFHNDHNSLVFLCLGGGGVERFIEDSC